MRVARECLEDVLGAIAQIEKHTPQDRWQFDENELIQVWMVHHLQVIGEAIRSLDPAFRQQHPQIPWREIAGMRNILVHDYSRVNLDIVWETVATQVPKLKSEVETILSRLPPET